LSESRESHRAPSVCAACGSIISQRPPPFCSRCKVTCYCCKECQTVHWKRGHKSVCRPASEKASTEYQTSGSSRPSFSFDIEDETHPKEKDGMVQMMINHNTGRVQQAWVRKIEQRFSRRGRKCTNSHPPETLTETKNLSLSFSLRLVKGCQLLPGCATMGLYVHFRRGLIPIQAGWSKCIGFLNVTACMRSIQSLVHLDIKAT
jgi:hypothetical protein